MAAAGDVYERELKNILSGDEKAVTHVCACARAHTHTHTHILLHLQSSAKRESREDHHLVVC